MTYQVGQSDQAVGEVGFEGEKAVTPDDLNKLRFDAAQRAHEQENEFANAASKAAIDFGTLTIKSLLLVNGGSCVAILAFIGTLATNGRPVSAFAGPLFVFAMGAGLSVVASAVGYFTNLAIAGSSMSRSRASDEPFISDNKKSNRQKLIGEILRWIAVVFAILAVVSFFIGLCAAYNAFRDIKEATPLKGTSALEMDIREKDKAE